MLLLWLMGHWHHSAILEYAIAIIGEASHGRKISITVSKTACVLILTEPFLEIATFYSLKVIADNFWLLWNTLGKRITDLTHFIWAMCEMACHTELAISVSEVSTNTRLILHAVAHGIVNHHLRTSILVAILLVLSHLLWLIKALSIEVLLYPGHLFMLCHFLNVSPLFAL